ncbi:MAG TPA: taurine dioxygenase, partial [Alphaproteobacteria bacterium]|nr:taurine dioxygenase [Alphaproteobacteria bacterium]
MTTGPQQGGDRRGMITVSPVSGALGAEIDGIDLSQPLSEQQIADIRAALLEHLVIFFRNQDITPADHLRFASYFSEPEDYPMITGLADFPKIVPVVKLPHERVNFGGLWHSDTAYTDIPPMGAVLVARELPPFGGDTLFANMYLAYEQLSDGLKRLLSGLRAVNSSAKAEVTATREDRLATDAKLVPGEELIGVHPVVRTHPETGRKLLYVNYGHTVRFEDMTEQESKPLLDYLFAHLCRPEFTCRFRWEPGSIAFWDNRAVQH